MAVLPQLSLLLFTVLYHDPGLIRLLELRLSIVVVCQSLEVIRLRVVNALPILDVLRELPVISFLSEFKLVHLVGKHCIQS